MGMDGTIASISIIRSDCIATS